MGRDRSLDEFVGGGDDGSDGEAGDNENDGEGGDADAEADDGTDTPTSDAADDCKTADAESTENADGGSDGDPEPDESAAPDPREVEPATATYRWEPDGVECAACGATVERLWSGDDGQQQVCADCKEW